MLRVHKNMDLIDRLNRSEQSSRSRRTVSSARISLAGDRLRGRSNQVVVRRLGARVFVAWNAFWATGDPGLVRQQRHIVESAVQATRSDDVFESGKSDSCFPSPSIVNFHATDPTGPNSS